MKKDSQITELADLVERIDHARGAEESLRQIQMDLEQWISRYSAGLGKGTDCSPVSNGA